MGFMDKQHIVTIFQRNFYITNCQLFEKGLLNEYFSFLNTSRLYLNLILWMAKIIHHVNVYSSPKYSLLQHHPVINHEVDESLIACIQEFP